VRKKFRFCLVTLALVLVLTVLGSTAGTPNALAKELHLDLAAGQNEATQPIVLQSTKNDTSPPLADLVAQARPNPNAGDYDPPLGIEATPPGDNSFDPTVVQDHFFGGFQMPLPIHNFEGIYNIVDFPSVGIPPSPAASSTYSMLTPLSRPGM
jgi:hypothetical protein